MYTNGCQFFTKLAIVQFTLGHEVLDEAREEGHLGNDLRGKIVNRVARGWNDV